MKTRIISGAIILFLTLAFVLLDGPLFYIVHTFIGCYSCYEYIKMLNNKLDLPLLFVMLLSVFSLAYLNNYAYAVILFEIVILMSFSIFDENRKFNDISSILLVSILLGYTLYFMRYIEDANRYMLLYVIFISYFSDVFAYFTGKFFGKHKLNERVSPNKTIEGSIGGWLVGAIGSFIIAKIFNYFGFNMSLFILSSLLLPLVSQIGDLTFSLIKRHYNIKDFSNLIPGHGGLLDRLDSNIFCIIIFGVLFSILR